jgi:hypothetical protein
LFVFSERKINVATRRTHLLHRGFDALRKKFLDHLRGRDERFFYLRTWISNHVRVLALEDRSVGPEDGLRLRATACQPLVVELQAHVQEGTADELARAVEEVLDEFPYTCTEAFNDALLSLVDLL